MMSTDWCLVPGHFGDQFNILDNNLAEFSLAIGLSNCQSVKFSGHTVLYLSCSLLWDCVYTWLVSITLTKRFCHVCVRTKFHPFLGALGLVDITICCNTICTITSYWNCSLAKKYTHLQTLAQFLVIGSKFTQKILGHTWMYAGEPRGKHYFAIVTVYVGQPFIIAASRNHFSLMESPLSCSPMIPLKISILEGP